MKAGGKKEGLRSVLSSVVAAAFFLICFFALQWNFLLCTLLAIGLFAGLMLLTRPSPKAMERLEEEATAREKLREARKDFVKIQAEPRAIFSSFVKEVVCLTCSDIDNPLIF